MKTSHCERKKEFFLFKNYIHIFICIYTQIYAGRWQWEGGGQSQRLVAGVRRGLGSER